MTDRTPIYMTLFVVFCAAALIGGIVSLDRYEKTVIEPRAVAKCKASGGTVIRNKNWRFKGCILTREE